jgi:hypothetical protein
VESRADDRGTQQRELGFQRRADGAGEPGGCLHDDVDEKRPAGEADLVALPFQVGDGRAYLAGGAVADAASAVEHTVDRRLAQAGLDRDLADTKRMGGHCAPEVARLRAGAGDGFLMGFCC